MADNSNDVFRMLSADDKLDGDSNYPLWAYMMQHVLVSKGVWNIVQGFDVRPGSVDAGSIEDVAGPSSSAAAVVLPTAEQARWDGKDAQAHALIALSVKRNITPHIRSAKTAKQAWDTLAHLYAGRNEAKISYLRKELESKIMQEEDDMNVFLAEVKDLKEQLICAGEIIPDHSLVQTVLDALPESYQTFASTWRLVTEDRPDAVMYDTLVNKLLQEAQSRHNRARQRAVDQAFVAAQQRRSGKPANSYVSSPSSRPVTASPSAGSSNKFDRTGDKGKKKLRCNYCKANDHVIKNCPKIKAKEAKKKESNAATIADASTNSDSANVVQDAEWAFTVRCQYDPSVHDACMAVSDDSYVWYFDSGATKHITSHRDMFTSLEAVPTGNTVTCANNASYPVKGVGKIVLTAANGSSFTLVDALYVPGIKKNLLSVSALARLGLVVKFVDDRCTVHDLTFGDTIIASGTLFRGLYRLNVYDKCVDISANAVSDEKAVSDAKLWHARFGHLNFASLLRLQKSDMVASLPPLEAPLKHVCEGCILGKMQRSSFPKDGSVRATRRLQLIHSDVCGPMQTPSFGNHLYFVTFIDDYSRHAWVYPLKAKSEVFLCFKQFLLMAENVSSCTVGTLRSDRGGEYMSKEFDAFLAGRGIKHQFTVPYTPQQNGVAERKNRSLMEMARCMVKSQQLPHAFWLEAVMCAAYILNRCPTKALQSITPYEAWHGKKPSIGHLRVFGCLAYALVPMQQRRKLDDKAVKCIFVGYSAESNISSAVKAYLD